MSAAEFLPKSRSLPVLAKAAQQCEGCDLYKHATQAVFGEGPATAAVMFIGEQPGDKEDQSGHPFVGPAGRLLDETMERVGIDRSEAYITNAVKHFKWIPAGKRRLHKKPDAREINACRPWLEAEMEVIQPRFLVCLGATAAQSLLGKDFRITRQRGEVIATEFCEWTMATWHPSALLRVPDPRQKEDMLRQFESDLAKVAHELHHHMAAR